MCFDGALGNMQIASDLRVVTALEQQVNDLPFPRTHLAEILFHIYGTLPTRRGLSKWRRNQAPRHIWIRVFASHFAFTRPNRGSDVNKA